MFQRYVASVVYRCCKSRSGCCTCCNGYTRMFLVYVPNVSSVLGECWKCFIWMLHIHACCKHMFQVFSGVSYVCLRVFYPDVAYVCIGFQMFFRRFHKYLRRLFKCFICLLLYVAVIACGCFKSRSDIAQMMRVGSGRRRRRCLGRHGQRPG